MKKIILALAVLMAIPAFAFARGPINLTLGAQINSGYAISDFKEMAEGTKEFEMSGLGYGFDANLKVLCAAVDATAFVSKVEDQTILSGAITGSLAFDILFVRPSIGLGITYSYNTTANEFGVTSVDTASLIASCLEQGKTEPELGDVIKNSYLTLRGGVDVLLGKLTVGVNATIPTAVTAAKKNWGEIKDLDWESAKVGVGIGISIF